MPEYLLKPPVVAGALVVVLAVATAFLSIRMSGVQQGVAPLATPSPFTYTFNVDGTLEEAPTSTLSRSPYFWLDSGGELVIQQGVGMTLQGNVPLGEHWQELYARNNPRDTDNGAHPQNIFRLLTRSGWNNAGVQMDFFIAADNFSSSTNRNSSNGLLLMSRYQNGDTLYYAGVRVDGTAVIKKKYHGTYYTMAQKPLFPGTYRGVQDTQNLLPHGQWISLRSETTTKEDGSVSIILFMRPGAQGQWQELLSTRDAGQFNKTPPLTQAGLVGVRTDFMDVQFRNLTVENII